MLVDRAPKVSVVVPVLNVKPYLRDCLDSILNQTIPDIEVICGDGGSTDGSFEILQEYAAKDPRVQTLCKSGSGYGQSVNDCIRMAKGEYIGIVESDDMIKPDMFETLYRVAKEKRLDWVRGDIFFYYTSHTGKPKLRYEKIIIGNFYNKVLNPQTDPRPYRSRLRTWSGIYRRKFLEDHHITHNETSGASYQDVGFYLKTLYYAKRVAFVHHAFYMWRQDNETSSIHFDSVRLLERSCQEWNLNWAYLLAHPELDRQAVCGFRYRQFLAYLWMVDSTEGAEKKHAQKIVRGAVEDALENKEIERAFFIRREWSQLHRFLKTGNFMDTRTRLHRWLKECFKAFLKKSEKKEPTAQSRDIEK